MKTCARCKQDKPLEAFNQDKTLPSGLSCYCRTCRSDYERDRRNANKDAINARVRDIRAAKDKTELRIKYRMHRYNITRKQAERVEEQTTCEWCKRTFPDEWVKRGPDCKVVHHNHDTGEFVATLCGRCNSIEGWVLQVAALAGMTAKEYLTILMENMI